MASSIAPCAPMSASVISSISVAVREWVGVSTFTSHSTIMFDDNDEELDADVRETGVRILFSCSMYSMLVAGWLGTYLFIDEFSEDIWVILQIRPKLM